MGPVLIVFGDPGIEVGLQLVDRPSDAQRRSDALLVLTYSGDVE
jgi:hypothetical protein